MEITTQQCLRLIGDGMRLRVPRNGNPATLVDGIGLNREPIAVGAVELAELLELTVNKVWHGPADAMIPLSTLTAMTEFRTQNRAGWRECGIDGEGCEVYAFTQ